MDIRAKVSSLACQLGALWYPNTVDECRFKDGDCDVFLDVIKFLFEYYWDSIGNDVIRLNRKCIPASWVVHGCSSHEEEEVVVVGQQRRIVVGLLFGDEQKRRESFRKMSRICRDVFDMKMPLGEDQFVRKGFVLKKLDIVLEILKHLRDIHAKRVKKSKDMRNSATAASAKKKKNDGSAAGGKRASETREKNRLDDDGLHAPRKTPNDIISSDPAIFPFLNHFMDPFWVEEDPVDMCTQNAMQEDPPVEFGEFLVGHPHAAMDDCTWLSDPSMHGHEATINPLFSSSPVSEEMTTLNDGITCLHRLEGRIRGALAVLQQVSMHCEY